MDSPARAGPAHVLLAYRIRRSSPGLPEVPLGQFASTFSLYDVQAPVVAAVFRGRMKLPARAEMDALQKRRKDRLLLGTFLNSIFLMDDFVIQRLLAWADGAISGPDQARWDAFKVEKKRSQPLLGIYEDNYEQTFSSRG